MDEIIINNFNKNFACNDIKSIKELYKTKEDIFLFNNKVLFHSKKYLHPLFLNYNYCLFCFDKRKTKYYSQNLFKSHNNEVDLIDFMKIKKFKLKVAKNKKEKIIRRFIHSFEYKKNDKNKIDYYGSDTELYIEENNEMNMKNKENNKGKIKNTKEIINLKSINKNNYKNNKFSINDSSSNSISQEIIFEDINLNINLEKRNKKITFHHSSYPITKLKSQQIQDNIFLKEKEDNQIIKDKNKKKLNKSSDLLLVSEDNTNYSPGYFSILKDFALKNVKAFKKNNSKKNSNPNNKRMSKNNNLENSPSNYYKLKNQNCSICLGEIREKFTLICGDFFCRECITELVRNCLKDISKFEQIICPLCKESIEDDTLKKILTEEEFIFYQKINTRIRGIKDKNLIACPFPDCEGFAEKSSINKNNLFCCQNNHAFCGKCKEIVSLKHLNDSKFSHKCTDKYDINLKYFRSNKNIKKCPNCECWVQKEQKGCNNMTCSNIWCQFEFCWICRKAYDDNHYNNPLSMCYGLASSNQENYFTKGKGIRFIRCSIIFLFITFIILPFVIIIFSIIEMMIYIVVFVLDGSALKYIKLKTKCAHRLFYKFTILIYFWLSLALLPVGYISLLLIIISMPFICLIKNIKKEVEWD